MSKNKLRWTGHRLSRTNWALTEKGKEKLNMYFSMEHPQSIEDERLQLLLFEIEHHEDLPSYTAPEDVQNVRRTLRGAFEAGYIKRFNDE